MQVVHRKKGADYGDRQSQDWNESRPEMEQENDDDHADDNRLLDEIALKGGD